MMTPIGKFRFENGTLYNIISPKYYYTTLLVLLDTIEAIKPTAKSYSINNNKLRLRK